LTDATLGTHPASSSRFTDRLAARKRAEKRFQYLGVGALGIGLFFLVVLFWSIISQGYTAFLQSTITLDVEIEESVFDPNGRRNPEAIGQVNIFALSSVLQNAVANAVGIDPGSREAREAADLLSSGARVTLRDAVAADPSIIGTTQSFTFLASGNADAYVKGVISAETPEDRRLISDRFIGWIDQLREEGAMQREFNTGLFTFGASSRPEQAGLYAALIGSAYMMLIVLALALPIGVMASIYLEEFAPKNRFTDLIEVNINNLAAVPSIVFGILGLALFINFVGLPRSAPLVGGLVLTLMTLPTIIIATRAALKAVPPSIREAALGVGASKMQTVTHHVLPLAAPGILTGTILGLAQALGETAPLLLIGMVAFVAEAPSTPLDPGTALPVQIYMWAQFAERGFVERTSAAIIVLLAFMLTMNLTAILLRRRFERRW
jgi:phosphate transport system permease protein